MENINFVKSGANLLKLVDSFFICKSVILQCKPDPKEDVKPRSGMPCPTTRQMRAAKKIVESNTRLKAANVGAQLNVSSGSEIFLN